MFNKKQPLNLIITGGPNSGKGTQCALMCERYNLVHISTGDLLREKIAALDKVGLEAKVYMDKGEYVPDDVIIKLLKNRIKERDAKNGVLLDGFPRTKAQSDALDKLLKVTAVIYLEVDDETLINRSLDRRICKGCKKIFKASLLKGKKVCDSCGEELYTRSDDNREAMVKRLETYHNQTESLIEKYSKKTNKNGKSLLIRIDASKTIPEVDKEVEEKLMEFLK